ncbi:MAG: SUMF1/EgtB/PvdO family nonheme iron enzyme, partial [Planctomycetes bacterium]|nr:SUMF1/EgtB/PvdO family nonheme iron enzyme [Planctomycetota bacterium]
MTAFQRTDESGIVDINYVLEDADGDPCLITVVISADGGSTWTITPSSEVLSGDVGSGVKPGRNQIVWASRIDLPGAKGTQYMALVTADDGDGGSYSLPASMVFVAISDPGVSGHDGFSGQMSVNETTNAEYCQYLNAAMAERLITVHNNVVYAANDTSYTEPYLATHAADSGSQITYSGGTFRVHTRDGRNMARHPVVQVSWYGATAFCHFYSVRLPTEWEWQAVADYDGSYTYGCGSTISQSRANYRDSVYANPLGLSDTPYTSPVGHFSAFGYGLCDIAGNAWEWTDSVYSKSHRVVRGGSWRYYDTYCAVWRRNGSSPHSTNNIIGFRVCRGTGSVLAGFHSSQSTLFALSNGNGGPSPSEPAIYVDDDSSSDPGPNNPLVSDPQEDGSANHPFDTVQEAIDAAPFGATVRVLPGHYVGRLNLLGKSITVTSLVDIDSEEPNSLGAIDQTILDGNGSGPVVTFASHEGTACVLQGFTITGGVADAGGGILCDNSAPMISHCLITGNQATRFTGGGVDCYGSTAKFINCSIVGNDAARGGGGVSSDRGADLFINCIIWGNTPDAVLAAEEGVSLTFCSVEGSWMGGGNLDLDPQFVVTGFWALPETMDVPVLPDTEGAVWIAGDYHLESRAGHYDVDTAAWMKDAVSSPCIDAGDPNMSYEREPDPNGARINMGAYGGTMEASKARPELALLYDFNLDTNPVWTTQGQWQFGYPMGQGGANGHSDPASGFSGQNVYGVNLAGDYDLTEGGPYSLTAGPFDCRDQSHVALRFARWLNSDAVRFVRHRIEVSNNGTAWQVIWEAPRELDEVTDSAWQIQEYDISDVADQQVAVWVRWTYEVLDRALAYSGWNIDD